MIVFCCGSILFLGRPFLLLFLFRLKVRKREEGFTKGASSSKKCQKKLRGTRTVKIRRALPVDLCPTLQSHLFVLESLFLPLLRVLSLHISRHCIIHWCRMEPYLWDIYGNFMSLEAPARRAAKRLQASAAAVSDSIASTALSALRRESEHRASIEKSIADQLVVAADIRPKRFRTKWQRAVYDGPTARKDAEASERGPLDPASGKTCSGRRTRQWEN